MKKTRMEKGITLVALIITIVVLLILAAVAINSIQNDGLIGKVNEAATKWNESVKKEQGILDDYLEFLEVGSDIGLLKKYVLGEDYAGRDFYTEIYGRGGEFIDDDILPNASKEIEEVLYDYIASESGFTEFYYIKYNKNPYKITVLYDEESEIGTTKDVELIYVPQGREGTQVLYDSNGNGIPERWIVITDRNGKLEIVSSTVISGLTLGEIDSSIEVTSDLDGDGIVDEYDDEIASSIKSYNEAITQINDFCRTTITATNNGGVRSIGATQEKDEPYYDLSSYNLGHIKLKQGDITDCEEDLMKLMYHNIVSADETYCFSSRMIGETSRKLSFGVRSVDTSGDISVSDSLIDITIRTGAISSSSVELNVRPVVINPVLTPVEEDTIVQIPLTYTGNPSITEDDNVRLGDANQDDDIDTGDLGYLLSILSGEISELTSKQLIAADMNKDNKITEEDVNLLEKVFRGEIEGGRTSNRRCF